MKTESTIKKRTVVFSGHPTSVSLEDEFWKSLKEIAASRNSTVRALVAEIDSARSQTNLSSAIRLFVLQYYQAKLRRAT
jgi:predicted DNA-binding ribbon-helix-helix protein